MPNTIVTPQMLSNELLMRLKNNLGFVGGMDFHWEDEFAVAGKKVGDTLNLRVPVKFTAENGANLVPQDVEEKTVPLNIGYHKHTAFAFPQRDQTLSIDMIGKRYLESAAVTLANAFDVDALDFCYKRTSKSVGSPGTIPTAIKTYSQANALLNKAGTPIDDTRTMAISSDMNVEIVDALKLTFNSQKEISEQFRKGRMGFAYGMNWVEDQNVRTHQVGPLGGTPLVNGAGQVGSTLVTDGWTAAAALRLNEGDIFTIDGVYAVNPVSGDTLANLKQFVVRADASSDVSGNLTISISPEIRVSGPYKSVSALPADNAPINVVGTANTLSPQGLLFHPKAFTRACVPFELPNGTHLAARSIDKETGLSIAIVGDFDINTYKTIYRCDIQYGFAVTLDEFACRVQS